MSKNWMTKEISNNFNKVKNIDSNKVNQLKTKEVFDIKYIDISKIVKNKFNFYPIIDVDELADDIKENGLAHNIVVRPLGDKYEIISGERRFTALTKLHEEGMQEYKTIPCKVMDVDDIQSMIMLIQANAQSREITENIKLKQVKLLNDLYAEKKANKTMLTKDIQEEISNSLNISVSQVKKYEAISKASDKIQEGFERNDLTFREATSLARLSKDGQNTAMEIIENSDKKIDIEGLKKEIQIIEKEHKQNNLDENELNKGLDIIKDKYIKTNNNQINEMNDKLSNEVSTVLIKKQITQVNKKVEDIISNISRLSNIDDELLSKINELEEVVSGIRTEVSFIQNK